MSLEHDQMIARASAQALHHRNIRMLDLATEIEVQFKTRAGPINYIMASAHQEAVLALATFATVDLDDAKKLRELQNDVKRYSDMAEWLLGALANGRAIYNELEPAEIEQWARDFVGNGQET